MNDLNGRCLHPEDPSSVPAIDEVLGTSRIDQRIRLVAEMARARGIKSLDDAATELEQLRAAERAADVTETENGADAPHLPCAEQKW